MWREEKTRGSTSGSHCASLSLLALVLCQAFSLLLVFLLQTYFSLSFSRFTEGVELLERDRQKSLYVLLGGAMTCILSGVQDN